MKYLITNQTQLHNSKAFQIISLDKGIDLLENLDEIGLDTETTGLNCFNDKILLLQLGVEKFQVLFDLISYGGIIPKKLKDFMLRYKGTYILQNAKFDLKFLFVQDILLKKVYDTMLAETIITNGLQFGGRDLGTIAKKYCGVTLDKGVRSEIVKRGLDERVLIYGAEDVKYLPAIKRKQLAQAKDLTLTNAINLDNSFVVVLAYVEFCGIKIDYPKWKTMTDKNVEKSFNLKFELEEILLKDGKTECFSGMVDMFTNKQTCILNWNSPKQVLALFNSYGIKTTTFAAGKEKNSIDSKVLSPQVNDFPILKPYLAYKASQKLISTYGYSWKNYINPSTNRIHTTFKQLMDTGRLSCGNKRDGTPNLQNLPSDAETRGCFIPEKGNSMTSVDYNSQEQIVLANFSQEENLINFYKKGFSDMHSYVAFLMYPDIRKCALEELTPDKLTYLKKEYPEHRKLAKNAGFAINYGGNGSTIAKNCSIPKKDGEFVYENYFKAFPKLKDYFNLVFNRAAHFGYIEFNDITKRKYLFLPSNDFFNLKDQVEDPYFWQTAENPRDINRKYNKAKSEIQRLAQNYRIQGSSADITKFACVLFFKKILKNNWWGIVKIVNLVHDEIIIECPKNLMPEVKQLLIDCMVKAGDPFCPIITLGATADEGDHWIH